MNQPPQVASSSPKQMPRSISPPRTPARFHQPKYHKLLNSPLYTKNVDLKRASQWLTDYLTKECPTEFMPAIRFDLMGHMEDHEMPDGMVAQSRLLDMNVLPVREVERMMTKFWDRLLWEQAKNRDNERNKRSKERDNIKENISGKSGGSSPQEDSAGQDKSVLQDPWERSSMSSTSRSSWSPTSAPKEPKRARTEYEKSRLSRVYGRDAHIDELTRRAHHSSRVAHNSRTSSSSHSFIQQYSPGPCQASRSRDSSHKTGYSPSFFAEVSQSN